MTAPAPTGIEPTSDDLGSRFESLLREACHGRLGPIWWFRTDWQRGGARTGRSMYRLESGAEVPVVVKVPVGPGEYLWNKRLQPSVKDPYGVTATLYDSGENLGNYDLIWIVIERFPEGPLFNLKRVDAIALMADAAARFYKRTREYPIDTEPRVEDWPELINRARENTQTHNITNDQRWNKALKCLQKKIGSVVEEWRQRTTNCWIHGDLHPANAMSRSNRPEDPAMLIDLAEVRVGHWLEDAVYLERLFWTRREYIREHPPVKLIAQRRAALGLNNEENLARLADLRRLLLAATVPAFLKTEGSPAYLEASLAMLEDVEGRLQI